MQELGFLSPLAITNEQMHDVAAEGHVRIQGELQHAWKVFVYFQFINKYQFINKIFRKKQQKKRRVS